MRDGFGKPAPVPADCIVHNHTGFAAEHRGAIDRKKLVFFNQRVRQSARQIRRARYLENILQSPLRAVETCSGGVGVVICFGVLVPKFGAVIDEDTRSSRLSSAQLVRYSWSPMIISASLIDSFSFDMRPWYASRFIHRSRSAESWARNMYTRRAALTSKHCRIVRFLPARDDSPTSVCASGILRMCRCENRDLQHHRQSPRTMHQRRYHMSGSDCDRRKRYPPAAPPVLFLLLLLPLPPLLAPLWLLIFPTRFSGDHSGILDGDWRLGEPSARCVACTATRL